MSLVFAIFGPLICLFLDDAPDISIQEIEIWREEIVWLEKNDCKNSQLGTSNSGRE